MALHKVGEGLDAPANVIEVTLAVAAPGADGEVRTKVLAANGEGLTLPL